MKATFPLILAAVQGHSNMFKPTPRGNAQWSGYCSRGNGCTTACDAPKSESKIHSIYVPKVEVKRGEPFTVQWKRQNHPGGFVRLAVVPLDQSDDEEAFNRSPAKYVCYETNCREDRYEEILGKNNGNGDATCSTEFIMPRHLNGTVTLQWLWFGGGVYFADAKAGFAHYVSCSDIVIKGGVEKTSAPPAPVFQGGDAATSDKSKCRFWSTDSARECPKGAEDSDMLGCGYKGQSYGSPKEWRENPSRILA